MQIAKWVLCALLACLVLGTSGGGNLGAPRAAAPDPLGCWTPSPLPAQSAAGVQIRGITMPSAIAGWAVGSQQAPGSRVATWTQHWDGATWQVVPSPNGRGDSYLYGVAVAAADDVWAVGSSIDPATQTGTPLILHGTGTQWTALPVPVVRANAGLRAVAVVQATDVWAVGYQGGPGSGSDFQPLILHWDGTRWHESVSPPPGAFSQLNSLTTLSATDIWAVGDHNGQPLAEHWTGAAWQIVPVPGTGRLAGVAAVTPTAVWAVGDAGDATLVVRWNGTAWSIVPGPTRSHANTLQGIAVTPTTLWVAGSYVSPQTRGPLLGHWSGTQWDLDASFPPQTGGIQAITANPEGDIWLASQVLDPVDSGAAPLLLWRHTPTPCAPTVLPPSRRDPRRFPQTQHSLSGRFLDYWSEHGGLEQNGYPLSEVGGAVSAVDQKLYTTQYFERAVFEYHPENAAPYDVLLSLLGVGAYHQRYGPTGAPNQQVNPDHPRFFPETGHTMGGKFRAYWESHGGLAQQGYPISDEFTEINPLNGKLYTVQYFQRAVFEWHPENAGTPYEVLLSQLGRFKAQQGGIIPTLPR